MKIAHISDLHICSKLRHSNIKRTRFLLNYIVENNYDHIVISGDITDNAETKDFKIFREILEQFDLLDSHKVSLVIGNHDIFGGIQTVDDILDFPSRCQKVSYKSKINQFGEYFLETFSHAFHPNDSDLFPYVKNLGDAALIGINSIAEYSHLKNTFAAKGKVSKEEIAGIQRIFSSKEYLGKIKIVLIHHHFFKYPDEFSSSEPNLWRKIEGNMMKLTKKKRILKLFANNNVKLILHGHIHGNCEYTRNNIKIINAGLTFNDINANLVQFNSITIEKGEIFNETVTLDRSWKSIGKLSILGNRAANF
ncbi:MAG: metallophosphoesterase [Bacteroidota bacterium]|nr:metallophosphoesterase [Bacteroidota bacterium]MDP4192700.1 metallophosphoesterase [Bacteroidota bacterium]MDP4195382.1 metallophosphoesterase [Bacteroidota bacterium]